MSVINKTWSKLNFQNVTWHLCFTCVEPSRKGSAERKWQEQERQMLASLQQWELFAWKVITLETFLCLQHTKTSERGWQILEQSLVIVYLSVIPTARLWLHTHFNAHTKKKMLLNVCIVRKAVSYQYVDSPGWKQKEKDRRLGSTVDRNMVSFSCNGYLQTIQLVNRSLNTLAHWLYISQFKNNSLSQKKSENKASRTVKCHPVTRQHLIKNNFNVFLIYCPIFYDNGIIFQTFHNLSSNWFRLSLEPNFEINCPFCEKPNVLFCSEEFFFTANKALSSLQFGRHFKILCLYLHLLLVS